MAAPVLRGGPLAPPQKKKSYHCPTYKLNNCFSSIFLVFQTLFYRQTFDLEARSTLDRLFRSATCWQTPAMATHSRHKSFKKTTNKVVEG